MMWVVETGEMEPRRPITFYGPFGSPDSALEFIKTLTDQYGASVHEVQPVPYNLAARKASGLGRLGMRRRLRTCVEVWPECEEGQYNPSCCRFPKSCSCTVYDPAQVTEADLEPQR